MDGIPINTADGYGDFQEIDPTAYKYVEVFKGGNALRFGANSLGGAINFVTPSGRDPFINGASVDAGAFGFRRLQANAGGSNGPWDGFITASTQASDGYRDHSDGHATRMSGNLGYQFSPDFETRFYLNANDVRQRIPGTVSKELSLTSPQTVAAGNIALDQQRNIDTVRIGIKTTMRFDNTTVEFGVFGVDRHLMHPIFTRGRRPTGARARDVDADFQRAGRSADDPDRRSERRERERLANPSRWRATGSHTADHIERWCARH